MLRRARYHLAPPDENAGTELLKEIIRLSEGYDDSGKICAIMACGILGDREGLHTRWKNLWDENNTDKTTIGYYFIKRPQDFTLLSAIPFADHAFAIALLQKFQVISGLEQEKCALIITLLPLLTQKLLRTGDKLIEALINDNPDDVMLQKMRLTSL